MTRHIARLAAALVVAVGISAGMAGCSSAAKPDEPVAFAQAWLQAAIDYDKGHNCDRLNEWATDRGRGQISSCDDIWKRVSAGAGVQKDADVKKDGNCVLEPDPSGTGVQCFDDVHITVVGTSKDLLVDGYDVT